MARLLRPVTRMISSRPEATASSTTYWMMGLSTSGSISLGWALVAGRKRVPSPAAGKTALRTFMATPAPENTRRLGEGECRERWSRRARTGRPVLRRPDLDPEFLDPRATQDGPCRCRQGPQCLGPGGWA